MAPEKSPQKSFYDREAGLPRGSSSLPGASSAPAGPGHRYHCIADMLDEPGKMDAVELGFGQIEMALELASRFSRYVAVDISADILTRGTRLPFEVEIADLSVDFPFQAEGFDVVIAMMVIEHLFDPFHSFREMARICRPGGFVFVNVPNIASIRCRLDLLRGRVPWTSRPDWFERGDWDGGHLHNFTIDSVRRLAALSGLDLLRIYPVGNLLWLKRLRPSLFCHEVSFAFGKPGGR